MKIATYSTPGTLSSGSDDKKSFARLIARRHPLYESLREHWNFLESCYEGGRSWFSDNIFRYIKEGDSEFSDRVKRAYRFNHTREVVDLVGKYLFRKSAIRSQTAPKEIAEFWKKATRKGESIDEFVRQVSLKASIYGRVAVVVDSSVDSAVVSQADAKRAKKSIYAYTVAPQQLLDYSFDDEGKLNWILIEEIVRDDEDPFSGSGELTSQYRLWTKTEWMLFTLGGKRAGQRSRPVELADSGEHGLGIVPVVLVDDSVSGSDKWKAKSMIDDIAYLDRATANYLSNLDAIIQDQTFSQLAMPAQGVLPGTDEYTQLVDMGTKRIFLYDGEGGQPFYLSPDVKQAQLIIEVVNKIIAEIYHSVGLAGERTKQDNAVGIDNSSGVAKAYDFERVNALLSSKADALEVAEDAINLIVAKWSGIDESGAHGLVSYPDDFDTRGLADELDLAAKLQLITAPDGARREQMKLVIDKLFPQLKGDLRKKLEGELKKWPIDPIKRAMKAGAAGIAPKGKSALANDKGSGSRPRDSRQGQVTGETPDKQADK